LELVGITRREDLLGIVPVRTGVFRTLLEQISQLLSGSNRESMMTVLLGRIESIRPASAVARAPGLDELVYQYGSVADEELSYQIVMQPHWPGFGNNFLATNVLALSVDKSTTVSGLTLSYLSFANCDLSGMRFKGCRFIGTDFSFANLDACHFEDCDLSYTLFHDIDGRFSVAETCCLDNAAAIGRCDITSSKLLKSELPSVLINDSEVWVPGSFDCAIPENERVPIGVSTFVADRHPVSNGDFLEFVERNPQYGPARHALDIENPYYLSFSHGKDAADLPVVYVSLVAAVAFAIWKGKRLPSAAEFYLYNSSLTTPTSQLVRSDADERSYDLLPRIRDGVNYGGGIVTEWSLQIDDSHYWSRMRLAQTRRMSQFPPYRRARGRRCEYFICGKSLQPKTGGGKNSKGATWFNPDQSFRCVLDYPSAIFRHLTSGERDSAQLR
jgi:hypothetical protein